MSVVVMKWQYDCLDRTRGMAGLSASREWMTVRDLMAETGMSHSAAYSAASTGNLPVPVYRFGGRYMISRQAWNELKARKAEDQSAKTTEVERCEGSY